MIFIAIFCRIFQFVFNYGARVLPWRKAIPIEGAGCIEEIPLILRKKRKSRPMIVTARGW